FNVALPICVGIVFTIVEDHLKHPGIVWKLSRVNGLPSHSVAIRHTIAILDALQIAIRRPAGLTAILLVCSCNKFTLLILKNPPRILTLVLINDGITLVVIALADKPTEDACRMGRVRVGRI